MYYRESLDKALREGVGEDRNSLEVLRNSDQGIKRDFRVKMKKKACDVGRWEKSNWEIVSSPTF